MARRNNWLNRDIFSKPLPSLVVTTRTGTRSRVFALSFLTQVALGLFAIVALAWLAVSTVLATNQMLGIADRDPPEGTGYAKQLQELRSRAAELAATNDSLRQQAEAALDLVLEQASEQGDQRLHSLETFSTASGLAYVVEVEYLLAALAKSNENLERANAEIAALSAENTKLSMEIKLEQERTSRLVEEIVDSVTTASSGLEELFSSVGLSPAQLRRTVRRNYSGMGGSESIGLMFESGEGQGAGGTDSVTKALFDGINHLTENRIAYLSLPFGKPLLGAYRYTSGFGYRPHPKTGQRHHHNGLDFAAPTGTPVYATGGGTVVQAGWYGDYGNFVRIRHMNGVETYYAHLSKIHVKRGQQVSISDRIGDIGSTGESTGPHLHYEVRIDKRPVDPFTFMRAAANVF